MGGCWLSNFLVVPRQPRAEPVCQNEPADPPVPVGAGQVGAARAAVPARGMQRGAHWLSETPASKPGVGGNGEGHLNPAPSDALI